MKRFMVGLAVAGVLGGCATEQLERIGLLRATPIPAPTIPPAPTPTPSAAPTPSPYVGRLAGRLTFQAGNPGQSLQVGLKYRPNGQTPFSKITKTATSTDSGEFTFTDLATGDYQVMWDDGGVVAAAPFNTTGIAVSDPVALDDIQSSQATAGMELAWDFFSASPQPNATLQSRTVTFSWPAKTGVASPVYQVVIFQNAGDSALQSSTPTTGTTVNLTLSNSVAAGTRYYIVKYWKDGGTFGGSNYYGQTKPMPIIVP